MILIMLFGGEHDALVGAAQQRLNDCSEWGKARTALYLIFRPFLMIYNNDMTDFCVLNSDKIDHSLLIEHIV